MFLDEFGWRVKRIIFQMKEYSFPGVFLGRFWVSFSFKVVSDGEVEDRPKEGFLVASHNEAVEECANLGVDCLFFGVEAVKPVDHAKYEPS